MLRNKAYTLLCAPHYTSQVTETQSTLTTSWNPMIKSFPHSSNMATEGVLMSGIRDLVPPLPFMLVWFYIALLLLLRIRLEIIIHVPTSTKQDFIINVHNQFKSFVQKFINTFTPWLSLESQVLVYDTCANQSLIFLYT